MGQYIQGVYIIITHMNKPRINFNNLPYSDSFTDIDQCNTVLQIGNTDYYEDVFNNTKNYTYLETICELVPNYLLNNNVQASIKYRNRTNESINREVKYNLYDNSIIEMKNAVSSIDVVLRYIIKVQSSFNNSIIYTKKFGIQNKNIVLQTNETQNSFGFINTTSNAYLFSGSFKPNNIQQYLFYIRHNCNEEPYISLISSKNAINNTDNIIIDPSINLEYLSTLQDDIINGKIIIDINNNKYKSILLYESTLVSNKFNIVFKRITDTDNST